MQKLSELYFLTHYTGSLFGSISDCNKCSNLQLLFCYSIENWPDDNNMEGGTANGIT